MDVFYPLSTKSKWGDSEELRYSLRSVSKFLVHDRVFLLGHKPDWCTNVTHIPFADNYLIKDANIISKLLRVCYEDISPEFYFMSDDQFFLQSQKTLNKPTIAYHTGLLSDGDRQWNKRCFNTREILQKELKPILNFDCHVPQMINKHWYPHIMLQSTFAQGVGVLTNSYYFNTMYQKQMITPAVPDKVNDFLMTIDNVDEPTKQRLQELFPEKSEYES